MSKYSSSGVLFDSSNPYNGGYEGGQQQYQNTAGGDNLQFYASNYNDSGFAGSAPPPTYYDQAGGGGPGGVYGNVHQMAPTGFWSAFGTGGYADEPPLLEGKCMHSSAQNAER